MISECPLPPLSTLSPDRRALISCDRCRRLKKKCKQLGRARCQRCIETDQVCRYSDLAEGQERGVSLSPPPSPTTKLIFPPPADFPDSSLRVCSPSPPPARGLPEMDIISSGWNEVQSFAGPSSPPSQPPSFQPAHSTSPILDPRMTSSSISPSQYDNNATTSYGPSQLYPQQQSYNPPSGFLNYSTDSYDAPFESTAGYMVPPPSSPSKNYYDQGSPSPTHNYPYDGSQLTEPYSPWSDPHTSMPTGTMAPDPYSPSRGQSFKQTNAVASSSNQATPSYNNYTSTIYDTGAGASGSTNCQYCYAGYYCSYHGRFRDDMMQQ